MSKVVHFEIPVDDAERAQRFYSSVFGWTIEGWGEEPYWLVTAGDEDEMGADGALLQRSEVHAAPVVIVGVDDIDAALQRATDAGAKLVHGKNAVPGMGWSGYVEDPEGNVIGVWQTDESAA